MTTKWQGWVIALGAPVVAAFVACGDDSSGTGPLADAGPTDGSSGGPTDGSVDGSSGGPTNTFHVVLLHTNDLHGHLEGHEPELDYTPLTANDDSTRGGFARLAAHVAAERATASTAGKGVILADAGDFMMGTAFSSFLGVKEATELYEMVQMKYDAIALGNHEFDFTALGLAGFIQGSILHGGLPPLVSTNSTVPASAPELKSVVDVGIIAKKKVVTLSNGLKVGFIGVMGKGAASVAPLAAPVTFDAPVTAGVVAPSIQTTVDDLRNNDKVDVVIALSHSGTDEKGAGEDNDLAAKAKGIDIVVSGHTHVALPTPISVTNPTGGTTYVVSTGAFGLNLGKMEFTFTRGTGVKVDAYALQPIDDTVAGDPAVQARIDGYVKDIDGAFTAAGSPIRYLSPVGGTGFDLPNPAFQETSIGDLVTDAYLAAANTAPGPPSVMAVEASGNIRSPLLKGKTGALAFGDVFNVVPLGIGPDKTPGYPLTAIYLTAKDIVSGFSLSAAAADPASSALGLRDNDYFLQISGASYKFDLKQGTPLTHVTHVEIGGAVVFDTVTKPVPDSVTCYRVVSTYYLASLLGLLQSATGGALSATPKQADCATAYTAATLPNAIIDGCPACAGPTGHEIKEWQALVGYIAASPKVGGIPIVPASYAAPAGRIVSAP